MTEHLETCIKNIFTCHICGYTAKTKWNYDTHMKNIHVSDDDEKCPTCKKVIQRSLMSKHKCEVFTCDICGYSTNLKDTLKKHMKNIHISENYQKCPTCKKVIQKSQMSKHKCEVFTCDYCGKVYYDKIYFETHKKKIHERAYVCSCDICGKEFSDSYGLKKHFAAHHSNDTFECNICGKICQSETSLKQHIKKVHAEKSVCTICGKEVRNLEEHIMSIHKSDEERKFQCSKCGKGFALKNGLEKHDMNVHLKLRPYECRYGCEFRYNDSGNRNAHEKKKHGKLFGK